MSLRGTTFQQHTPNTKGNAPLLSGPAAHSSCCNALLSKHAAKGCIRSVLREAHAFAILCGSLAGSDTHLGVQMLLQVSRLQNSMSGRQPSE